MSVREVFRNIAAFTSGTVGAVVNQNAEAARITSNAMFDNTVTFFKALASNPSKAAKDFSICAVATADSMITGQPSSSSLLACNHVVERITQKLTRK